MKAFFLLLAVAEDPDALDTRWLLIQTFDSIFGGEWNHKDKEAIVEGSPGHNVNSLDDVIKNIIHPSCYFGNKVYDRIILNEDRVPFRLVVFES